jgi:hypothetical protein
MASPPPDSPLNVNGVGKSKEMPTHVINSRWELEFLAWVMPIIPIVFSPILFYAFNGGFSCSGWFQLAIRSKEIIYLCISMSIVYMSSSKQNEPGAISLRIVFMIVGALAYATLCAIDLKYGLAPNTNNPESNRVRGIFACVILFLVIESILSFLKYRKRKEV